VLAAPPSSRVALQTLDGREPRWRIENVAPPNCLELTRPIRRADGALHKGMTYLRPGRRATPLVGGRIGKAQADKQEDDRSGRRAAADRSGQVRVVTRGVTPIFRGARS
jgi:hypothetical protein